MAAVAADLDWRDAACAVAIAVAVFCGAWVRTVPGVVGGFHDDAVYALTAQSLADGEGYRLRNLPGHPPQTKYPILFPSLLAATSGASSDLGASLHAMQRTTALVAALAVALAYLLCVRFGACSRVTAAAGVTIAASAPNFLYYCAQPLSEMPFLALTVLALWAAERRFRSTEASPAGELLTGMLLGLPFLCRSAGIVLPVAAAIVFVLARDRLALRRSRGGLAPLAWMTAGVAMVALPWIAWSLQAGAAPPTDAVAEYQTDYLGWWKNNASTSVIATNFFKAAVATAQIPLESLARTLHEQTDSARLLLFALGALPWIAVLRRSLSLSVLPVTVTVYLVLVCVWPWPPDRFLVPVLPFVLAFGLEDLRLLVARVAGARGAIVAVAALVLTAGSANALLLSRYVAASDADGYPHFVLTGESVPWSSYAAVFDWLREHTKEGDVLAAGFDTMTALYTQRPTIRPFAVRPLSLYYGSGEAPLGTADEMVRHLETYGVRYFLATPMPAYAEEAAFYDLVNAVAESHPKLLRPVWQAPGDPRFVVFEVAGRVAS